MADDPNTEVDRAAACIIARNATDAMSLARAVPGTNRESALIADKMPILAACLGPAETAAETPRFTRSLGRVAELLYARRGRVISVKGLRPRDQDRLGIAERSLDWTKGWPAPAGTITCAVDRDPMTAEVLIHTMFGSVREKQALAAFVALLPPCLPAGEALHATAAQIRSIVARARLSDDFQDDRQPVASQ